MSFKPSDWTSKKTVFHTAFYLLGSIVQKGAFILLLPILVIVLTPDEFSRFGLLTSVISLVTTVLTVMVHAAPTRLYFDYTDKKDQDSFLISVLGLSLTGTLLGLIVLAILLLLLGVNDPITLGNPTIVWMLVVAVAFQAAMEFGFSIVRVQGKAALFLVASLTRATLLISVFIWCDIIISDAMARLVFSFGVANFAVSFLCVFSSFRGVKSFSFKWSYYRDAFHFSWPLVIHMMASWALSQSGRWIGILFFPMEMLAPYILVVQITLGGTLFVRAIYDAKRPEIGLAFGAGNLGRGKTIIVTSMIQSFAVLILLFALLYIALFLVDFPLLQSYRPTQGLFLAAFLACLFDTFYSGGVQLLVGLKETKLIAICTVIAGICTVLLSFPLAKSYGVTGLAIAMAVGIGLQATMTGIAGWRKLQRVGENV